LNSFGRIFRIHIFGESHGECVGLTVDGCPAGLPLQVSDFIEDTERRKGGVQKGTTPRKEDDLPIFKSGIFNGHTTGAPVTILFENNNTRSGDYEKQRSVPRPGHADFTAHAKYGGFEDFRGGGHFSGRLTVCLVAAGGIVECRVTGLPVGLGEHFFDSVESLISHAVFAIPAVKGIEFGAGFAAAKMFGVDHNDAIEDAAGKTRTNHAGGIVGGITNGNELIFRVVIKPTSSTPKEQITLNWETNELETFSVKGRHDLCIALRVPVILEAVAAMVLVDLMLLDQKIKPVLS
jgi:chorismate synthase